MSEAAHHGHHVPGDRALGIAGVIRREAWSPGTPVSPQVRAHHRVTGSYEQRRDPVPRRRCPGMPVQQHHRRTVPTEADEDGSLTDIDLRGLEPFEHPASSGRLTCRVLPPARHQPSPAPAGGGHVSTPATSHARRTLLRRSTNRARPNVWRLSILIRLTWPSTTPEYHGWERSATTASRSRSRCWANRLRLGRSVEALADSIHSGSCSLISSHSLQAWVQPPCQRWSRQGL